MIEKTPMTEPRLNAGPALIRASDAFAERFATECPLVLAFSENLIKKISSNRKHVLALTRDWQEKYYYAKSKPRNALHQPLIICIFC
jgi:hypothetical protein